MGTGTKIRSHAGWLLLLATCLPATVSSATLVCPDGWSLRYARCYLVVPQMKTTWDKTLQVCQRHGGVLVEPSGHMLTEEVGTLVTAAASSLTRVWIGYNRRGLGGDATVGAWSDGRATTVGAGAWGNKEPKTSTGDCAYMQRASGSTWYWYMANCDLDLPFVCQATPCPDNTFRCDNGRCVGQNNVCNKENNCGDESDEKNCPAQCSYYVKEQSGSLIYPTSGTIYLPTQTCQWGIEGTVGSRLQLQFVMLKTERDLDFVEVWVGGSTLSSSTLVERASGTAADLSSIGMIVSSNNLAIVRFLSDGNYQNSGFHLTWDSQFQCSVVSMAGHSVSSTDDNPYNKEQTTLETCSQRCSSEAQCVAYTYNSGQVQCAHYSIMPIPQANTCCNMYVKTCPGSTGFPILSTVPNQGGDLYATSNLQRFFSPLYPTYYMGDLSARWTIHSPGRQVITLQILNLDLAAGDVITVYDGADTASTQLATMTRSDVTAVATATVGNQKTILSTGSIMLVQLKTRYPSKHRGFLFGYRAGCTFSVVANSGRVISPGYKSGLYPNILECVWNIHAEAGRSLTLTFDSTFSLEDRKDFLEVRADGLPVHSGSGFTGSTPPATVVASAGWIELVMKTGATGRAGGFGATFNADCVPINDPTLARTYTADYGQSIVIQCAAEQLFAAPNAGQNSMGILCLEGGVWSKDPIPSCRRVFCGPPVDISNGYLASVTGVTSGDTATYKCEDGFQLSKSTPIVCRSTGAWDNAPFCFSTQSCPSVPSLYRGRTNIMSGSGIDHGSVVNFNCTNPLYELVGSPNLICENGQWSGGFPTCERIQCPVPYIANGTVSPSSSLYDGQPLTAICNTGFQLTGASIFNCGDNPPQCTNANECQGGSGCSQNCTDTIGSYYCSCRAGYHLALDGRTCADINECSVNKGNCDGLCINSVGSYRCDCVGNTQLYTYDGQFGLVIPWPYEDGLEPWNVYHINHTCIQTPTVQCPSPHQNITNGHLLGETGTFIIGEFITYLCDMGFQANGPTTLRCTGTGAWDAAFPVCNVATCPVPTVAVGTVTPQAPIQYLDNYTVTCDLFGVNPRTLTSRCVWDKVSQSYRADVNQLRCDTSGVDCGIPKRLPGSLPYNVLSTSYNAQFTFQCRTPLFTRVGTSRVTGNEVITCGADGVWDFGDLRCEGPTCPDPGTEPGTQQVATTYEEFGLVTYKCLRSGFELTYPWALYCQYDSGTNSLKWNGTAPVCRDTEPPTFANCSTQVRQVFYLASPLYTEPVPTDNVMVKELTISPADFRTTDVIENSLQVSYIAKDHAGNIGTCVVTIQVRDDSPPVIRCHDSFELQLNSEGQVDTYDPLTFVDSQADNSGIVSLNFTTNPLITDYFTTGNTSTVRINANNIGDTYTVKINGQDPSGNSDSCLVQIKVTAPKCVPWSVRVANSSVTCFQRNNSGYQCDISCNTGYKFYEDLNADTISMTCDPGADWSRVAPVCTRWYYTNYRLEYQMDYRTRNEPSLTCQATYLQQLNDALPALTTALSSLCNGITPPVTVSASTKINAVAVTPYADGLFATIRVDLDATPNNEAVTLQCAYTVNSAFTSVSSSLQSIRNLNLKNNCAASETVRYRQTLKNVVNCQTNQEGRVETATSRFQCAACPLGYTSADGVKCSPCSAGSYFDSGTASCQFCPSGTNSQTTGARLVDDCYLYCPYGYVSSTGMAPCKACPENTYSLNRTYCEPCPSGLSTRGDAQGYPQNCLSPCQPGNYSFDGYSPCSRCPRGYFQDKQRATTCVGCSSGTTTLSTSATSASDCVPAAPVVCNPNPCFNGSCTVYDHDYTCICEPGYTGRNCENAIRPCDSNPCYNDAICVNNGSDYECVCAKAQTTGKNCETDLDDNCQTGPCSNFGACQDLVGNHICLCPSFSRYTYAGLLGSDCTVLRNPCADNPCTNGTTCVNNNNVRRKCVCPDGYDGDSCGNDIDYCGTSTNPCQNGGQCQDGPGTQVRCVCQAGYTGQRCEIRQDQCNTTRCGVSSTCVDNYITDQVLCYCNEGFDKVNGVCQAVVINPCDSSPCQNGATCNQSIGTNAGYRCICPPGYEGLNCQHNIDDCLSMPCINGGTCTDLVNGFRCSCPPNTREPVCQDNVDQCSVGSNPCSLLGTLACVDYLNGYSCTCLTGYYGQNCTEGRTNCASFPCRHGGTCTDVGFSYQCTCPDGYQGTNCETVRDYCSSNPCHNGSLCVNTDTGTVCNCPPGYRGDRCQIVYDLCTVANPCTVPGSTCSTDSNNRPTCTCPSGYSGDYCEVKAVSCAANTCENGGTCREVNGVITCQCVAGFTGSRCETNIDECASSPCTGNTQCVDGINSYTCQCDDDRIGDGCKVLSVNFDLVLRPSSTYVTPQLTTFPLYSTAITVATWVRFTDRTNPGTMLSLYGLSSQTSVTNLQQILRMDKDQAVLSFAGSKTFTFTPPIDDGYWHHVVLTWDGTTGQAKLYVDNPISASTTNYGQGSRLADFGWLVLGGTYDSTTDTVNRTSGMVGRLSRLHVSTETLSDADVSNLHADLNLVPSGTQRTLTKSLLKAAYSAVDYNSQLTLGYCRTLSGCRSIDQVTAHPSVTSCPDDQMVQMERQAQPSWSFLSSDPALTNYFSGSADIGWGDYGVWYTQSDDDGDTAVCTFVLHTRRSGCESPVPPRFGSQSCATTSTGQRCEPQCSGTYTLSEAGPRYYSCGQYSMFDQSDRVLQYSFPSCTTCQTPLLDLVMSLNFTTNASQLCANGQSQLSSNIRTSLDTLNAQWQQGLCGGATCSGVRVDVTCPADASQGIATKTYLRGVKAVLRNFDSSVQQSPSEILSIAVVDNSAFTYSFASTILSSLVVTTTKTCISSTVLLGDCCIKCGLGHYLNNNTGECTACSRGTYLDQLGQTGSNTVSPCKTCPSGLTTPGAGAQSETDCKTNCLSGRYFDCTTGQCELCPVGYFAENPGAFYCDPCPYDETTAGEGSSARTSCSVNPITTTAATTNTASIGGSVGASTAGDELSWPEIVLIVLAVILIIIIVLVILICCFREHLVKACPCLVTKVKPQDTTGWHYVDKFGETKMKFVSYRLADRRARNSDKDLLGDSVDEGSVHTNISLQIPVFEERLNGQVKMKPVHMSEHTSQKSKSKKKKRRTRKTADLTFQDPAPLRSAASHVRPVAAAPATMELPSDGKVRRPLSAFNKPRPTLDDLPYENFVSPLHRNVLEGGGSTSSGILPRSPSSTQRSHIMIDSDEDEI